MNSHLTNKKLFITKPGWYYTISGLPVIIQRWDYNPPSIPLSCKAFWYGMIVKKVENRRIYDWDVLWYTCYGDGYFPESYKNNFGDLDIAKKLPPSKIPADEPQSWMPIP